MTGSATGPHLHFELINPQGAKVDPSDCYEKSKFSPPYGKPFEEPDGFQMPTWGWYAIGGAGLLIVGGIIIAATREEEERPKRKRLKPA